MEIANYKLEDIKDKNSNFLGTGFIPNEIKYNDYWERVQEKDNTIKDLQAKINKAIEYIDRRDIEWGSEEHNKLLSILKGSDKE